MICRSKRLSGHLLRKKNPEKKGNKEYNLINTKFVCVSFHQSRCITEKNHSKDCKHKHYLGYFYIL